ncbi:hypothetical protein JR316_0011955 [Psilocybe cubensis]|uniref:Uncharacterized protein n=1 Tax=Psilocybe cubensis TaxID=181762 RepID=A0ACB8GKW8_PSICU|nr:hypothetical protein JR316_0011955 [Psilocybe cubensis]KAH9476380.1 hypothetical protein JR316_0011955 [Psilocybe cubensis]
MRCSEHMQAVITVTRSSECLNTSIQIQLSKFAVRILTSSSFTPAHFFRQFKNQVMVKVKSSYVKVKGIDPEIRICKLFSRISRRPSNSD